MPALFPTREAEERRKIIAGLKFRAIRGYARGLKESYPEKSRGWRRGRLISLLKKTYIYAEPEIRLPRYFEWAFGKPPHRGYESLEEAIAAFRSFTGAEGYKQEQAPMPAATSPALRTVVFYDWPSLLLLSQSSRHPDLKKIIFKVHGSDMFRRQVAYFKAYEYFKRKTEIPALERDNAAKKLAGHAQQLQKELGGKAGTTFLQLVSRRVLPVQASRQVREIFKRPKE